MTLDYANREIYLENPNYKDGKEETFTISQPDPRKRGRASGLGLIRLGHQSVDRETLAYRELFWLRWNKV